MRGCLGEASGPLNLKGVGVLVSRPEETGPVLDDLAGMLVAVKAGVDVKGLTAAVATPPAAVTKEAVNAAARDHTAAVGVLVDVEAFRPLGIGHPEGRDAVPAGFGDGAYSGVRGRVAHDDLLIAAALSLIHI